ncbi:hypothetical protein GCM10010507_27940 [Streptomyces cinnamoneus]|uniref:Uncharacterized protein n=1 Tax=Streptomyces cinnamoneus TaxID=53446 RepID=A0A918WK89_STRCJ|nr:hypothetical protein GCM10010507_27940 [Streptomyces cinnamoneus]
MVGTNAKAVGQYTDRGKAPGAEKGSKKAGTPSGVPAFEKRRSDEQRHRAVRG